MCILVTIKVVSFLEKDISNQLTSSTTLGAILSHLHLARLRINVGVQAKKRWNIKNQQLYKRKRFASTYFMYI